MQAQIVVRFPTAFTEHHYRGSRRAMIRFITWSASRVTLISTTLLIVH
jgi:hypothetical protein